MLHLVGCYPAPAVAPIGVWPSYLGRIIRAGVSAGSCRLTLACWRLGTSFCRHATIASFRPDLQKKSAYF